MAGAAAATCVTAASRGPAPLPWGGFCTEPCSIVLPWETISFYFCPFNSLTFVKHWLVVLFYLLPAWLLFPSPAASPSVFSPVWLSLFLALPTDEDILRQGSDAHVSWGKYFRILRLK